MYLSFTDKDKKTVHTHTSLLNEEAEEKIRELQNTRAQWRGRGSVVGTYVGLELVNRVGALKKLIFARKALVVGLAAFIPGAGAPFLYWKTRGEPELLKLVAGAPVYENKFDVPELDKLFFFLDDDNNYEPSLYHHGMYEIF